LRKLAFLQWPGKGSGSFDSTDRRRQSMGEFRLHRRGNRIDSIVQQEIGFEPTKKESSTPEACVPVYFPRRIKMKIPAQIVVAVFAFACVAGAQNAAPPSWTAELQLKTRAVGAPRVSPD